MQSSVKLNATLQRYANRDFNARLNFCLTPRMSRRVFNPMTSPDVAQLVIEFNERRQALFSRPASKLGREWMAEYTALLDDTLKRIYTGAWDAAREHWAAQQAVHVQTTESVRSESEHGLALVAVGGYGRGEMCPHSDVDIVFVPQEEDHPVVDAVVKEAFRLIVEVLIDGAKLDVGYAYRPLGDIERLDMVSRCALLDARLLSGSSALLTTARERLVRSWDGVGFLLEKTRERRELSQRVSMSLYSVSPNLKEGVGGLRETQTALWAVGAVLKAPDAMREMLWRGVASNEECEAALKARDWMLRVRSWLHLTAGRKSDVLHVDIQDRAARAFGYTGSGANPAQKMLRDYYQHAEAAHRFSRRVLRRLAEGPLDLDGHFAARDLSLTLAHPFALQNHPELAMTPFVLAQKYGFDLDTDLQRCIAHALPRIDNAARRHPIMRAGFLELLGDIGSAPNALQELRTRGVLQALMPEFEAMLLLAPADPSHALTVGEHSIYAVRKLAELWNESRENDSLRAVWDGVDDVELLVLGTLLHDCGKIEAGTDHSVSGAKMARSIGERLGLSGERLDRLALLVRRHLLLPRVARLRELSASGSLREVTERAKTVPNLKMLYLLSIADTQAVGERSYSPRDLDAMRELYERALIFMTRRDAAEALSDRESREALAQEERERLRREMRRQQWDDARLQEVLDTLPAAYVLNTPLPVVATHLRFLELLPAQGVVTDFHDEARQNFTDLTLFAYDDPQPGLLSRACGVLHAAGVDILEAQAYTLRPAFLPGEDTSAQTALAPNSPPVPHIALDRLQLVANGRPLSESRAARLAIMLRDALTGQADVEEMLKKAKVPVAQTLAPTRISARNDLSDEHTVITVVCENAPGLLYTLTRALSQMNLDIHAAKITTWAGRAEDAFYVTRRIESHDHKIGDDELGALLDDLKGRLARGGK